MKNISFLIAVSLLSLFACKPVLQFEEIYFESNVVAYDSENKNEGLRIEYQTETSEYLNKLKEEYPLNEVLEKADSDLQKVLKILDWTSSRWKHNGNNSPKSNDGLSILKEAETGAEFPCFAFAIVLKDQLNANGFKARTIYLKTKNARKSKYPPGHVATEVYLNDLGKWVFMDAQFNVLPVLDQQPLNAVEFQKAITLQSPGLKLLSLSPMLRDAEYYGFVYPYLYYLDTSLDHRYENETRTSFEGKTAIMLVPLGAKELRRINFWNMDIDHCFYSHSLRDFYARPI
ncbi:MAG: transglutaminase domain-containing protein [Saprospiraceae bacterium]